MSNVRSFVTTICITAVLLGVVAMLIPKGSLEKGAKGLLALVLLMTVVSIFKSNTLDLPVFSQNTATHALNSTISVSADIIEIAEKNLCDEIKKEINRKNLRIENIIVQMDISDKNSISITNIYVYLDTTCAKQSEVYTELIYTLTGVIPQIKIIGSGAK